MDDNHARRLKLTIVVVVSDTPPCTDRYRGAYGTEGHTGPPPFVCTRARWKESMVELCYGSRLGCGSRRQRAVSRGDLCDMRTPPFGCARVVGRRHNAWKCGMCVSWCYQTSHGCVEYGSAGEEAWWRADMVRCREENIGRGAALLSACSVAWLSAPTSSRGKLVPRRWKVGRGHLHQLVEDHDVVEGDVEAEEHVGRDVGAEEHVGGRGTPS